MENKPPYGKVLFDGQKLLCVVSIDGQGESVPVIATVEITSEGEIIIDTHHGVVVVLEEVKDE